MTEPTSPRARRASEQARQRAGSTLRLVFLSSGDPLDIAFFSGTPFHMVEALRAEFPDLEVLGGWKPPGFERFRTLVLKTSRGRLDPAYWPAINRRIAARLIDELGGERVLLISVVNSTLTGLLAEQVPTINISDATFRVMRDFYPSFGKLGRSNARWADEAEAASIRNAVHSSYSSAWAARSAVEDYGADRRDVSVIPWGCNLAFIEEENEEPHGGPCRLLFVGVEWLRKGGDVVIETARLLEQRGFPYHLDLVGVAPPPGTGLPAATTVHGFLRKADAADYERLRALFKASSYLFLPTRQDCTPMVFAEANAYGTPALTRDVGGVAGVVEHGTNGIVLDRDAAPADFADAIERAWTDRASYDVLRRTSRTAYERRLNWPAWAKALRAIIERLAEEGKA